jgi:hypothetical protein
MSTDERPDPLQALWQAQEVKPVELSYEAIRKQSEKFSRTIRLRNLREWAACALLVPTFGWMAYQARGAPLTRIACLLICAGVLYVARRLARDGKPPSLPLEASTTAHLAAYRADLEKHRDLLRSVARWYVGPMVPGLVLFNLGAAVEMPMPGPGRWLVAGLSLLFCAAVSGGVIWLNRVAARKLQGEIDALSAG